MRVVPPHIWTWTRATVQWSWGRWCWDFPAAQTKQSSSLTCRLTTRWPISYKPTLTRSLHWWWVWKIRPGRFLFWLRVYFPWSSLFLFGLSCHFLVLLYKKRSPAVSNSSCQGCSVHHEYWAQTKACFLLINTYIFSQMQLFIKCFKVYLVSFT